MNRSLSIGIITVLAMLIGIKIWLDRASAPQFQADDTSVTQTANTPPPVSKDELAKQLKEQKAEQARLKAEAKKQEEELKKRAAKEQVAPNGGRLPPRDPNDVESLWWKR